MPFARFMDLALYDPAGGYYRSAEPRPGRAGDFITAPELHPIFGCDARAPGRRGLGAAGPPRHVHAPRVRRGRRDPGARHPRRSRTGGLAARRRDHLRPGRGGPPSPERAWRRGSPPPTRGASLAPGSVGDAPIVGVVLANEVLDALPVHRVRQRGTELRELAVGDRARRRASSRSRSSPPRRPLPSGWRPRASPSQTGRPPRSVSPSTAGSARWRRGWPTRPAPARSTTAPRPPTLYDPVRRRDGTLRAYVRHQVARRPVSATSAARTSPPMST